MTKSLTEHQEQVKLFAWLKAKSIVAFAIPNGASLRGAYAGWNRLKAEGCNPGVPDIHVVTPPPKEPAKRVYLELKRANLRNQKAGQLNQVQFGWMCLLTRLDQIHILAYGANDAIDQLTRLGY